MELFIVMTFTIMGALLIAFCIYEDIFSRIMIAGQLTNVGIVIIVMLSTFTQRNIYIDIAIAYAILNFIGTKCLLNIVQQHNNQKNSL